MKHDITLESLGLTEAFNEQLAGLTPPKNPRVDLEANVEATPAPWMCARENLRQGGDL